MEIKEKIIILGATKYSFMIHDMIESEHKYTILCHTVSKKDVNKYNIEIINALYQHIFIEKIVTIYT